jgi:hypothetical protein
MSITDLLLGIFFFLPFGFVGVVGAPETEVVKDAASAGWRSLSRCTQFVVLLLLVRLGCC